MGLPRLEIRTQMGSLDIRSRSARLEGTPPGLELSVTGNAGTSIGIKTTHPRIRIDQSESWEAVGLEKPLRNMDKFAARSNRKGIEQIGRIAREGLHLMAIERGGRVIPHIARNKGFDPPIVLEVRQIPPPRIDAQMGQVEIHDRSRPVRTQWLDTADTRRYTAGSVGITWGVRPSIDISVVPGTELQYLDTRGSIVDTLV
jgi:hypothetical protein